jgi:hypothetical protein
VEAAVTSIAARPFQPPHGAQRVPLTNSNQRAASCSGKGPSQATSGARGKRRVSPHCCRHTRLLVLRVAAQERMLLGCSFSSWGGLQHRLLQPRCAALVHCNAGGAPPAEGWGPCPESLRPQPRAAKGISCQQILQHYSQWPGTDWPGHGLNPRTQVQSTNQQHLPPHHCGANRCSEQCYSLPASVTAAILHTHTHTVACSWLGTLRLRPRCCCCC